MADEDVVLASAVVLPEPDSPRDMSPPANNGSLKRRQSSVASTDSKRPRLSNGAVSPPTNPTAPSRSIRKPSRQEERQRGKRLFGALLGTLSQSKTTATQRRRAEIEQKQQDKIRQQTEEDEAVRRVRLEKLDRRRRREHWDWEERALKVRHGNLRAQARMLKTRVEPVLYYLPYEITAKEEELIKQQRGDVEDGVDRELDDFEERRRVALERLDLEERVENPELDDSKKDSDEHADTLLPHDQEDIAMQTEESIVAAATNGKAVFETTNGTAATMDGVTADLDAALDGESAIAAPLMNEAAQTQSESGHHLQEVTKDAHDDAGEVVEGEEDTVIY